MSYRTTPLDMTRMPPGIPWIIGNEAAERFSFYGMRAILTVFMAQYLWLLDGPGGTPLPDTTVKAHYHNFVAWVYFTPLLGALLSDIFLGKYRTIILLSLVYCAGHAALACMGYFGHSGWWLFAGLGLICLGSGGIKPCVSAHVGDQFGPGNQNLLTRIYNWFYFSINLGSFISSLLTPWVLEWYGPHWAFGIPGVLMAVATFLFWMGRRKFVHVPPGGSNFFRELISRDGLIAVAKLIPFFLFFVAFWALFDQTGSSWVLQAGQMDREFLGKVWLESQIQALNPVLVLAFIPIFTFFVYPTINRFFPLSPLRKIAIGLFVGSSAFAVVTYSQSLIDAGREVSIAWQFLAYGLITAAEVMVSIVGLEFAYTQAPRTMKSLIMSIFLLSVFGGNILVSQINRFIEIPSAAREQYDAAVKQLPDELRDTPSILLPGHDGMTGTDDDFTAVFEDGALDRIEMPAASILAEAARSVETLASDNNHRLPDAASAGDLGTDPWGSPLKYKIIDADTLRISSSGPDRKYNTKWDVGITLAIVRPPEPDKESWTDSMRPDTSWLDRRREKLGMDPPPSADDGTTYETSFWSGGQSRLEGASYFKFFTWLMLGTAIVFVPFSIFYKPRTYLQK
jgi:POT family proton-dependent oligopeptide transporter